MKRVVLAALALTLSMTVCVPATQAQWIPWGFGFDSSFKAGLLFGTQGTRYQNKSDPTVLFKVEYDTKAPVLAGISEVSPVPFFSARIGGALSVLEAEMTVIHPTGETTPGPSPWEVRPNFKSWESAGLLHLWRGGGYRFSLVGGYREDFWKYSGDPIGNQGAASQLRDSYTARIPFGGFQTAMFLPWWKSRFEVSGSPLVTKELFSTHQDSGVTIEFDGRLKNGLMIQVEIEGTAVITDAFRVGLYGKYAYQELYGDVTRRRDGAVTNGNNVYFGENFALLGLNLSYAF